MSGYHQYPMHHSTQTGVGRVTSIGAEERLHHYGEDSPYDETQVSERMTRRRTLTAEQKASEVKSWRDSGARQVDAPDGWQAWERRRRDTHSGAMRVLRFACTDAAPYEAVNWSVPEPVTRSDMQHWDALFDGHEREGGESSPPRRKASISRHSWTA